MAGLSPMMQHYMQLKEKYEGCLLFYRLGDFYEMFFDDAKLAAKELELTLTGRDCGLEERAPMCGVPHHAVDVYIQKLVERGYKVAVCEQLEDPALAKGLVERDVIRVISAGTLSDPSMLNEKENNFLLAVSFSGDRIGLAYSDVSTGEFFVSQPDSRKTTLSEEIDRIAPKEVICGDLTRLRGAIRSENLCLSEQPQGWFGLQNASDLLKKHFGVYDLSALGLTEEHKACIQAAGALLRYLKETQKIDLKHITALRFDAGTRCMILDQNTRRNLELVETIRGRNRKGSLIWLMDKTSTAMGGRLLRSWIEQPLTEKEAIEKRLDAVAEFTEENVLMMSLADELNGVYDMERLLGKAAYGSLNARDCLALKNSFSRIPGIVSMLGQRRGAYLREITSRLDPLEDLRELLERAIHPDAPAVITEGGIIRDGYSETLDEYRDAASNGKQWILDMEQKERELTGIKNLRIQYNRVFGYYIEVTKSYYDLVPERYIRKQTLANAERFMTPELKETEQKIIGAQEQGVRLELRLFDEIREKVAACIERIRNTAVGLKTLDALLSLARLAVENNYCRPSINTEGRLSITGGRHPVVEQTIRESGFIPNDTEMDQDSQRMLILTGPNMAGKSTYMRQVALIVLMAHIGSFVPAETADISVVDRIFTRVGASDDLASGQSTFMVEMAETAYILRNATNRSLVILDEIGRGTSTFDGLSIAWAVVEYLCDKEKCGAKTLFATHYHELSELEGRLDGVVNYCVSVKEHGEDVIFLRKIIRGGADKSFGVHVARLAGVPHEVLVRAHEIQARLEVSNVNQNTIGQNILGDKPENRKNEQIGLFDYQKEEIVNELQQIDVMALTPMDAINKLFLLREKARKL